MTSQLRTVLIIGATGSIGRHVVAQALGKGLEVRALTRNPAKATRQLPAGVRIFFGDVTRPETLHEAVQGVDALVFTHGSDGMGKTGAREVDYGAVKNTLSVLAHPVRIALMTAIGVTERLGSYNQRTEAHDWKRRAERLVRASGLPYTIVRPGWFDYNDRSTLRMCFLQGDTRHSGTPADGVISRRQIAQVLLASLENESAINKTFELVAEQGAAQTDLTPLFSALVADGKTKNDGVFDCENMPIAQEPQYVVDDLTSVTHWVATAG